MDAGELFAKLSGYHYWGIARGAEESGDSEYLLVLGVNDEEVHIHGDSLEHLLAAGLQHLEGECN